MSHVDDGTLHAYLDGELSPPEAQSVEAHVAQCPACRERLEEERALIARAAELLARAAPPDRDLPPFRPGDVRPPVRLWWQARLPLAWAATIALALGIGSYLGERRSTRLEQMPSEHPAVASRVAQNAPAPAAAPAPARALGPDSVALLERQSLPERRVRTSQPAAPAPPALGTSVEEKRKQERLHQPMADSIAVAGANALGVRESAPMVVDGRRLAAKAAAPAPARPEMMRVGDRGYALRDGPIGVDSARVLLGRDPLVVPDVPIRGIYRARMLGYSGMVIIEQALDASTVIDVINARAVPLQLDQVVVTGAGEMRRDSVSPGAHALPNARVADSVTTRARKSATPPTAVMENASQAASGFFVDVRGPLPADSLAALRRLLRPLAP
ncbi:MAG TPA: zf-HC2 domain-containing protein [Gemmatimonadales bacterium]|nr:zf-HC2 domain-containing protein [Gemmatimonadales bacterium]